MVAAAKGLQISKEQLEKMYQTMTCRKIAEHFGCGETAIWNRVKKYGIKLNGVQNPRKRPKQFTEAHLEALRAAKKKIRGVYTGDKASNWKGGAAEQNRIARASGEYKEWKLLALARAGNKCQSCGVKKGHVCECCGQRATLHVHHVFSFAKFPNLRFDPSNSEVLCARCHHSRHHGKPGEFGETPTA